MSGIARTASTATRSSVRAPTTRPDLTKITQQRGEAYLRQFLKDPSRFYSEEKHGRLMPNPNLSDQEAADVIAFLTWVSNIDNQNWPPRPILVSAATPQEAASERRCPAASDDPIALGEALFRQSPPACFSCHSTQPGVQCSSGRRWPAWRRRAGRSLTSPGYTGAAARRRGYIRESILHPNAYVVPGPDVFGGRAVDHAAIYDDDAQAGGHRPPRRLPRDAQVRGISSMRYRTQAVAYPYFVVAMLFYGLQMVFGLLVGRQVPRARPADLACCRSTSPR